MEATDTFVGVIARDLVAEIAPEESEFFEEIANTKNEIKAERDIYLGFGGEDTVIVFATTMLISVAKTVATFLWENAKDATGQLVKDCSKSTQEAIAKWFAEKINGTRDTSPIQISEETLGNLVRTVLASPDAAKLSPEQQTKLIGWIQARLSSTA